MQDQARAVKIVAGRHFRIEDCDIGIQDDRRTAFSKRRVAVKRIAESLVFVPADRVVTTSGEYHIEVAVAINIRCTCRSHSAGSIRYDAFGKTRATVVLIPGDSVVVSRCGDCIQIAITVNIGH